MIFSRILSNIIDGVIFLITYLLLFKVSRLEINPTNSSFISFLSFLVIIGLPVLVINNTFGKEILKLKYHYSERLNLKLLSKYFFYFTTFSNSASFLSTLTTFPLFRSNLIEPDQTFLVRFYLAYITVDFILFTLSLGKYHIADYILNISISNHLFSKKPFKNLIIVYLFFSILFLGSVVQFKHNLSSNNLQLRLLRDFYKEQYPKDYFYGNEVSVLKKETSNALSPSAPLTLIYDKNIAQKSLFLTLPEHIFNSEYERKEVCKKLIEHSQLNDAFRFYKPEQTRIVLSHYQRGQFFEHHSYFYIYYFNNKLPEWGIYGGISSDSTSINEYVEFVNSINLNRILLLEEELNLNWLEILKVAEYDRSIRELLENELLKISSTVFYDRLQIEINSSSIIFHKINFENSRKRGVIGYSFPISTILEQKYDVINSTSDPFFDYDENIYELISSRNRITNPNL